MSEAMLRTLDDFLGEGLNGLAHGQDLVALITAIAKAVRIVSADSAQGRLAGQPTSSVATRPSDPGPLSELARLDQATATFFDAVSGQGLAEAVFQTQAPLALKTQSARPFWVAISPLEGAANFDINATAGSIFGVWPASVHPASATSNALPSGRSQIAAGYAIYGPATLLVITIGSGTHGFTLDLESDRFFLTHPGLKIADGADEFAIDVGRERLWESPVQRYITECKAGSADIRGRDFHLRWSASIVADLHRILMRGGVALYPREQERAGHRFLLTEAAPIGMLVEQAGGRATTGRHRILDIEPTQIHDCVPLILGARSECERLERYHHEHDNGIDERYSSPLFKERSLFQ
ncbi:MAG: fructose-1,6-bisphosphatase [Betaproteobacteria bacterium]|nr:fructose-1,6-bisphosphatase [Betaproteobacteria bacterium]